MANSKNGKAGLAVVLGAAALASAGAYFLYGSKSAKKNRQKVKSWALKAKAEVLEQVEKVKQIDTDQYKAVVDDVVARYKGAQGVTEKELKGLGKELMGYWDDLARTVKTKKKKAPAKKK